jgi:RHH-type proline utilization regulon transcriptional repressor/proline dehydrogenase/delta 1-pyrroline-5-carboxylate dehydrogenase
VHERAACLERAADLLESGREQFIALAIREAGKTMADAVAEVREAVDFCRFYAAGARAQFAPVLLPGPTGERNEFGLAGRGVFACVSPWNFPLAIFIGQVSAALVAGNAVLAKPAPQTPLIAAAAVRLLLQAGVPADVIALLPGGVAVGEAIMADARLAGVAFTGSTATARRIAQSLLQGARPLLPLIAETGGINAMLVDSTALPEQVVRDVIKSAFHSAGQRCSALRLLCLQQECAEQVLQLLQGAMAELRIGDPAAIDTDVGPLIDAAARERIEGYLAEQAQYLLYRCPLPADLPARGYFVAPAVLRLPRIEDLQREVFGPVLHVVTWRAGEIEATIDRINASGYGLTLGVHSRISDTIERVRARARVGNLYVNRAMTGAVVGSQPFGGEGYSGTGPKAGGPHYLLRFATERSVSTDTTAAGGNVELLSHPS